ncbi:MAG: hypothetical protein HFE49_07225 [Clostridia bacterium]|nr:hypothetical protein [Clostridia bacterium]
MPSWTYSITIINNTDRTLELVSSSVPWGNKEKDFPKTINAGATGEFSVYSPAGAPWGLEFYFTMRDKPNSSEECNYGSFSFSVDMPYWKYENRSSLTCTGILTQSGFQKIPDGSHDFATTATISTTLTSDKSPTDVSEYNDRYSWTNAEKLEVVDPDEVVIEDVIPDKNILTSRKTVLRTDKSSVSQNLWNQIKDTKFPDAYSKKHFVSDYFTVMLYEIRKNKTISIAANQSYNKTLEISNRSTVRRETREELQIENVVNGSGGPEKFTLSETLRIQYQISNLSEYCEEDMKSVREEFNYDAIETDRNVVLWDLAQVLALYRTDIKGNTELIGIGDYYVTDIQKTYIKDGASEYDEPELECANSQENYNADDDNAYVSIIQGTVRINNVNYRWREASFGGLNRGLEFNPGNHRYKFRPNPHDDPYYNKHQVTWYESMASQIAHVGNTSATPWTQNNWPSTIRNLKVNGITYTAEER